jgi:hypothetical protein
MLAQDVHATPRLLIGRVFAKRAVTGMSFAQPQASAFRVG